MPVAKKKKEEEKMIKIEKLKLSRVKLTLEGITPLMVKHFSEKTIDAIIETQTAAKKATKGVRVPRDIKEEYERCFYKTPDDKYGFPVRGIKRSLVVTADLVGITRKKAKAAISILGDIGELKKYKILPMQARPVKNAHGIMDIRYRPEFFPWELDLDVLYSVDLITLEELVNLFEKAGFYSGLGEHRPNRNGNWGMFRVKRDNIFA